MEYTIAILLPVSQGDYLANTILDGFLQLSKKTPSVQFKITSGYQSPFALSTQVLTDSDFVTFARSADLIIWVAGKNNTNYELAEAIHCYDKMVFVDGSEYGRDRRYNRGVEKEVLSHHYGGWGVFDMVGQKCKLYFRRERPYGDRMIPFPYGIEQRYIMYTELSVTKKDIDFVCIFGQDEYPIMRRYATQMLTEFCRRAGFTCETARTDGFNFTDKTKQAGREEFSKLLARAKVGISIGGGGFDTARFWEILGNNCLLLTEKIAIFEPESRELDYGRIYQFENLIEFQAQLKILGTLLRTNYNEENLLPEYQTILKNHGTVARVEKIIDHARKAGILK